jgi:prevent-host-death family protein
MAGKADTRKHDDAPAEVRAMDARRDFADLLGRVQFKGERFAITKYGKTVALLIPCEAADRAA